MEQKENKKKDTKHEKGVAPAVISGITPIAKVLGFGSSQKTFKPINPDDLKKRAEAKAKREMAKKDKKYKTLAKAKWKAAKREDEANKKEILELKPVFKDFRENSGFEPQLVAIVDKDKKHSESKICQDSIGFKSGNDKLPVFSIFKDTLSDSGFTFYPDSIHETYLINPVVKNNLIELDSYFSFLRTMRIGELQQVAQDLGAKHFKITYKEDNSSQSRTNIKFKGKEKSHGEVNAEHDSVENTNSGINILAEDCMEGHAPQRPKLLYLANDSTIQNLITSRMDKNNKLQKRVYEINMFDAKSFKSNDVAKIEATLHQINLTCSASFIKEAQTESHKIIRYEIEF